MLNRYTLDNIPKDAGISLPDAKVFDLPEKVLQFGTGVLLRGLPDYFIDKANRAGNFNGRVVVVKSTDSGDSSAFDKQDGLYTICVRGIENGTKVEQNILNSSISRVISAKSQWAEVLQCAHNPTLALIISNTTEVGIAFVEDDIKQSPPISFPGKLLAFLYERYKVLGGGEETGMVIVPTELITENGAKLKAILLKLAEFNNLEREFVDWLNDANHFCNSLVDRIVPGAPSPEEKTALENQLTTKDDLVIVAEAYRLWAIESSAEKVRKVLSFAANDSGVVIAPDITRFRELKLRLLNGTHTLSCALALLAGHETVKASMDDENIVRFMQGVMQTAIIPAIVGDNIEQEEATTFAGSVLDRFRNPYIAHKWISISAQYASKMKMRNLPVLKAYFQRFQEVPAYFALGFAAFILFMRTKEGEGGKYTGEINGNAYLVTDDKAAVFASKWKTASPEDAVISILNDVSLWDEDLAKIKGLAEKITFYLRELMEKGARATIESLQAEKIIANS